MYDVARSESSEMLWDVEWHIVTYVSEEGSAFTFTGIRGRRTQLPELRQIEMPTSSGSRILLGYIDSYQTSPYQLIRR